MSGSTAGPAAPPPDGGVFLPSLRLPLAVVGTAWSVTWLAVGIHSPWRVQASLLAMVGVVVAGSTFLRRSALGVFSPFMVFLASGILYTVPTALTLLLDGTLVSDRPLPRATMDDAVWLSACALAVATLVYTLASGSRLRARPFAGLLARYDKLTGSLVAWALVILGAGALLFLVRFVLGMGSVTYGERYLLMRGLGPLLLGLPAALIGGGVLYLNALREGRTARAWAVLAALLGGVAVWTAMMETRAGMVQAVVLLLVVRQASGRRIRLLTVTVLGVLLLALGVLVSLRRALRDNFRVSVAEVPGWAYNPANMEFGAAQVTIADLVRRVPDPVDYRYGATYMQVAGILVPLAVWPGRPLAPGEWYADTFYPDVWARGGAFAFSPVAEAYLNLGVAGVVVAFASFALILAWLERRFLLYEQLPPWVCLAYALAVPYLITFFRLDMASLVKGYLLLTLLPLMAAAVAAHVAAYAAGVHPARMRHA